MVRTGTKELRDPHSYITFDDIFALALAKTKSTKFVADTNTWQRVLYAVHEKYKEKIPELKMMFFDESRSHLPPQSDEFYQLINILSASKLIGLPNPTYERILMEASQKERARNLEEKLLEHYEKYIEEIAKMLEERLGVDS